MVSFQLCTGMWGKTRVEGVGADYLPAVRGCTKKGKGREAAQLSTLH